MHSIKKLKKYAIAREIVKKVAKEDEWEVEGSLWCPTELGDYRERIARDYAGMMSKKRDSIIGCIISSILGLSGGYLGYKLGSNINENIHIIGIGRFGLEAIGGVLGFVGLPALYSLENKLEDYYIKKIAKKYSLENARRETTEDERKLVYDRIIEKELLKERK